METRKLVLVGLVLVFVAVVYAVRSAYLYKLHTTCAMTCNAAVSFDGCFDRCAR